MTTLFVWVSGRRVGGNMGPAWRRKWALDLVWDFYTKREREREKEREKGRERGVRGGVSRKVRGSTRDSV